jgi:hypothetical protein
MPQPNLALRMKADLIDVGLVSDADMVAAICAEIRSGGRLLVCHGCGDIEALIAGFLVLADDEEAWALCGPCLRKLPLSGAVV